MDRLDKIAHAIILGIDNGIQESWLIRTMPQTDNKIKNKTSRRMKFLNKITSQGGTLAVDSLELAPRIIEQIAKQDHKLSYSAVETAIICVNQVLMNAASNFDLSHRQIEKGYSNTLARMMEYKSQIDKDGRSLRHDVSLCYLQMRENYIKICNNPENGRIKVKPIVRM